LLYSINYVDLLFSRDQLALSVLTVNGLAADRRRVQIVIGRSIWLDFVSHTVRPNKLPVKIVVIFDMHPPAHT